MERNTKTTMYHLQIGDRFYKVNDKKKIVYTKVESETKRTHFQTYKHFALKDGERFPDAIKSTTEVIFLRHKEADA
jgi:hypothetical protein